MQDWILELLLILGNPEKKCHLIFYRDTGFRNTTYWKVMKLLVDRKWINGYFDAQHMLGVHLLKRAANTMLEY